MEKGAVEKQFEQHIRQYERLLHKICRLYAFTSADRQDLFQEIVIQLWNSYPRFKGTSGFGTWLYRVAINTAISGLRKKKDFIRSWEPSSLPAYAAEEGSDPAEEQLEQLYRAIGALNGIEKAIVMLYMEEHSYVEMEDILGLSQGALRVKMNRIKEKLRQLTKNN
ncbi:MAG: RNA polymerase sigma factor [Flavisolibacter sp.]